MQLWSCKNWKQTDPQSRIDCIVWLIHLCLCSCGYNWWEKFYHLWQSYLIYFRRQIFECLRKHRKNAVSSVFHRKNPWGARDFQWNLLVSLFIFFFFIYLSDGCFTPYSRIFRAFDKKLAWCWEVTISNHNHLQVAGDLPTFRWRGIWLELDLNS